MRIAAIARRAPGRVTAGAFILNSGLSKWSADEETAARLHGMAVGTYPFLAKLKPKDFAKLLSAAEIALGSALLLPVVPGALAGVGLVGFSSGLLGMYARTPGMRKEDGWRPSQQGIPLAKDVWMLGIGLGLVIDALTGKVTDETEIADLVGWAVTGQLRRDHPGQALFVDLNQDGSGVDVIDAMGRKQSVTLAVPFRLYDPKTLAPEEVRTRADKLVVLKRFKSFARGGDELQIFDLR